jgi:hypothetical protein
MGLLNWMLSGNDIAKPIEAVSDLYTTDKARLAGEAQLQNVVNQPTLAQLAVNNVLANSAKIFNSGWQPALGWSAGFLILLYYAPQIVITTIFWTVHCYETGIVSEFPMKPDDILNLVYLLFGFGAHHILNAVLKK